MRCHCNHLIILARVSVALKMRSIVRQKLWRDTGGLIVGANFFSGKKFTWMRRIEGAKSVLHSQDCRLDSYSRKLARLKLVVVAFPIAQIK